MGFIFDLDGTLLDSLDDLMNSLNTVLKKYGLKQHNREAYQNFVGNGMKVLVDRACPADYENKEQILEEFLNEYGERYHEKSQPYPQIIEMLKSLNEKNIPIAICTNKKQEYTDKIVEVYFNDIDFVAVYGDQFDGKEKPNPFYALKIADTMGLEPKDIYFVGDSNVDMFTANNANMNAVGVSWGFRSVSELKETGAKHIVHSANDILELLK